MKISPKQQLNKLLPEINQLFKDSGFTCIASWNAPNFNFKRGCLLTLYRDDEQIKMQTIYSNDFNENEKLLYQKSFAECLSEVKIILEPYFIITPSYTYGTLYRLELKNTNFYL